MRIHDGVIRWKYFPRYWLFVRGIHRPPVNFTHKGQWRGALMFYLICAWINGWVNNSEAGDLRRHRTHYCVTVMWSSSHSSRNPSAVWWGPAVYSRYGPRFGDRRVPPVICWPCPGNGRNQGWSPPFGWQPLCVLWPSDGAYLYAGTWALS